MNVEEIISVAVIALALAGCTLAIIGGSVREELMQRFTADYPDDPSHRTFFFSRKKARWRAIMSQLPSLPAEYHERYLKSRRYLGLSWAMVGLMFALVVIDLWRDSNKPLPVSEADCVAPAAPK